MGDPADNKTGVQWRCTVCGMEYLAAEVIANGYGHTVTGHDGDGYYEYACGPMVRVVPEDNAETKADEQKAAKDAKGEGLTPRSQGATEEAKAVAP